jgi:hypothetical protein
VAEEARSLATASVYALPIRFFFLGSAASGLAALGEQRCRMQLIFFVEHFAASIRLDVFQWSAFCFQHSALFSE